MEKQYQSPFKNYRAEQVPSTIAGSDTVYNVMDVKRDAIIGRIYADSGNFMPTSDCCQTAKGLREIANLADTIHNSITQYAY